MATMRIQARYASFEIKKNKQFLKKIEKWPKKMILGGVSLIFAKNPFLPLNRLQRNFKICSLFIYLLVTSHKWPQFFTSSSIDHFNNTKLPIPHIKNFKVYLDGTFATILKKQWPRCGYKLDMSILMPKIQLKLKNDQNKVSKIPKVVNFSQAAL